MEQIQLNMCTNCYLKSSQTKIKCKVLTNKNKVYNKRQQQLFTGHKISTTVILYKYGSKYHENIVFFILSYTMAHTY